MKASKFLKLKYIFYLIHSENITLTFVIQAMQSDFNIAQTTENLTK